MADNNPQSLQYSQNPDTVSAPVEQPSDAVPQEGTGPVGLQRPVVDASQTPIPDSGRPVSDPGDAQDPASSSSPVSDAGSAQAPDSAPISVADPGATQPAPPAAASDLGTEPLPQ